MLRTLFILPTWSVSNGNYNNQVQIILQDFSLLSQIYKIWSKKYGIWSNKHGSVNFFIK